MGVGSGGKMVGWGTGVVYQKVQRIPDSNGIPGTWWGSG